MKTINITCSNCGRQQEVPAVDVQSAIDFVDSGWGSYGSAFYCPECVKTWGERNSKPIEGKNTTFYKILNKFIDRRK